MDYDEAVKQAKADYQAKRVPLENELKSMEIRHHGVLRQIMLEYGIVNPIVKLLGDGHHVQRNYIKTEDDAFFYVDKIAVPHSGVSAFRSQMDEAIELDLLHEDHDDKEYETFTVYTLSEFGRYIYDNWEMMHRA